MFLFFENSKIIAPENSKNQPHFSFTIPAANSFHELKGRKLKKSSDLNFTAIMVKIKSRIIRTAENLIRNGLFFIIPMIASKHKIQQKTARYLSIS